MSTSKTNTPHGAPGNMIQQAVGVFNTCSQRNTQMRHLTGSMPQVGAAVAAAGGVCVLDGRMVDTPVITLARQTLERQALGASRL